SSRKKNGRQIRRLLDVAEHPVRVVRFSPCELKYAQTASRSIKDEIQAFTRRATAGNDAARRRDDFRGPVVHSLRRDSDLPIPNLRHLHSRRWTRNSRLADRQLRRESERRDERERRDLHDTGWIHLASV